ncbi:hypothetical protein CQJ30_12645 [Caldibacillus thermoamylovorans]|nr:hypothetical protein CQJ30_12645 [Caldibacillus thermoamylovorans]
MKDNETIFKRTCSINFRTNHSIFCHIGDLFFRWLFYGPILFVGLFIGVVFFVSAGSFLYFRLYMDLDEDKQKFSSIAKMGLTVKELKKVLTRCLYFDAKFNRFSPKFSYIFNNTISIFHVNLLT